MLLAIDDPKDIKQYKSALLKMTNKIFINSIVYIKSLFETIMTVKITGSIKFPEALPSNTY